MGRDDVAVGRHFDVMCQPGGCQALNHKKYGKYHYFFEKETDNIELKSRCNSAFDFFIINKMNKTT